MQKVLISLGNGGNASENSWRFLSHPSQGEQDQQRADIDAAEVRKGDHPPMSVETQTGTATMEISSQNP